MASTQRPSSNMSSQQELVNNTKRSANPRKRQYNSATQVEEQLKNEDIDATLTLLKRKTGNVLFECGPVIWGKVELNRVQNRYRSINSSGIGSDADRGAVKSSRCVIKAALERQWVGRRCSLVGGATANGPAFPGSRSAIVDVTPVTTSTATTTATATTAVATTKTAPVATAAAERCQTGRSREITRKTWFLSTRQFDDREFGIETGSKSKKTRSNLLSKG